MTSLGFIAEWKMYGQGGITQLTALIYLGFVLLEGRQSIGCDSFAKVIISPVCSFFAR